jgi:hypothetical protein
MSTGPNAPRPDHRPWIAAGVLLSADLAYLAYRYPALGAPILVAAAVVTLMAALLKR